MPDVPDHVPAERYDALLDRLAHLLRDRAPDGWGRIDLTAQQVPGIWHLSLSLAMRDGSPGTADWETGPLEEVLGELRDLWHAPGRGTWLSARFVMDFRFARAFYPNLDHDPLWDPPIDPALLARDLERYPRDPEHVPAWLRERTGLRPPGPPRADVTLDDVASLMVRSLHPYWREATVGYRAGGPVRGEFHTFTGETYPWTPPPETAALLERLRGDAPVVHVGVAHPGGAVMGVERSEPHRRVGIMWQPGAGVPPHSAAEARLMERIRRALAAYVPDDLQHSQTVVAALASDVRASTMAYSFADGNRFATPPEEVLEALAELRRVMMADNAWWYRCQIDMQPARGVRFSFFADHSVDFDNDPPPVERLREDLAMYGDPAEAPDWLHERIAAARDAR